MRTYCLKFDLRNEYVLPFLYQLLAYIFMAFRYRNTLNKRPTRLLNILWNFNLKGAFKKGRRLLQVLQSGEDSKKEL